MMGTEGALGELELAQKHGSGLMQPRHRRRIAIGAVVLVDGHAGAGRDALGMTKVLHGDRNAMQGAANGTTSNLGIGLRSFSQGQIGGERRIAPESAGEPRDTIENRLRYLG
jgi:hypothetical protein